jgi:carbon storage regulator CsrA
LSPILLSHKDLQQPRSQCPGHGGNKKSAEIDWRIAFRRVPYGQSAILWWAVRKNALNHGQEVLPMLVITRREGEEVVIGDPANPHGIIRVACIKGDRVRLAFAFPRDVEVHRREVANPRAPATPHIAVNIRPAAGDR